MSKKLKKSQKDIPYEPYMHASMNNNELSYFINNIVEAILLFVAPKQQYLSLKYLIYT